MAQTRRSCLIERELQQRTPFGITAGTPPHLIGTDPQSLHRPCKQLAVSQAFDQFSPDNRLQLLLSPTALILAGIGCAGRPTLITATADVESRNSSMLRRDPAAARLGDS